MLWVEQHLEMLQQMEQHLGPVADGRPEPEPAVAAAAARLPLSAGPLR